MAQTICKKSVTQETSFSRITAVWAGTHEQGSFSGRPYSLFRAFCDRSLTVTIFPKNPGESFHETLDAGEMAAGFDPRACAAFHGGLRRHRDKRRLGRGRRSDDCSCGACWTNGHGRECPSKPGVEREHRCDEL
jgi:hypothetical protein